MGRTGCTINGNMDNSKFNEPMPWIGIYVAVAAAACAVAMAADAIKGFRYRKFWFPCKYFSLNAMTLTVLAVAIKFSVDLSTSMPQHLDQLAKVSSSAFMCTVVSNLMPSLGTLENKELVMNTIALLILVITNIVNICIQLGTGVIYMFLAEHACIMVIMIVLLALLSCTSLSIPATKTFLDHKYREKVEVLKKECLEARKVLKDWKLRDGLEKYWMMAYTCDPQFVIGRSAICSASGLFCLLSALVLVEAVGRSYLMPWSFKFCSGMSDYRWSATLVLVTQILAVGIGSVGPICRWVLSVKFGATKAWKPKFFLVEKYWIQKLLEWKEQPLRLGTGNRHVRKWAHDAKDRILDLSIGIQKGIVLVSKLVRFISIFFVRKLLRLQVLIKCKESISNDKESGRLDCSRFVIYLEGEEELVDLMENKWDAADYLINLGNKKEPKNLIKLLEKFDYGNEFQGVREFDNEEIPSLDSEEPPNCWALPLVTLTSIAISLPDIEQNVLKKLVHSVNESLLYVREVENNLDQEKRDIKNTRKAADIVWLGVDLYRKWLDLNLSEVSIQGQNGKQVLERLADVAVNKFMDFRRKNEKGLRERPSEWPVKAIAANSMYRICKTLLRDYETESNEKLFDKLSVKIATILRACLSNFEHLISRKFYCRIEERLISIHDAMYLYGEAERIMKIVHQEKGADSLSLANIDDWHLLHKLKESEQSTKERFQDNTNYITPDEFVKICISSCPF